MKKLLVLLMLGASLNLVGCEFNGTPGVNVYDLENINTTEEEDIAFEEEQLSQETIEMYENEGVPEPGGLPIVKNINAVSVTIHSNFENYINQSKDQYYISADIINNSNDEFEYITVQYDLIMYGGHIETRQQIFNNIPANFKIYGKHLEAWYNIDRVTNVRIVDYR